MILTKWVIVLEFGKRLFYLPLKTACVPCCRNDNDVTTYEELQKSKNMQVQKYLYKRIYVVIASGRTSK